MIIKIAAELYKNTQKHGGKRTDKIVPQDMA